MEFDWSNFQITVPKGCCPGCGSKFQSEDDTLPGYLPQDKLEALLAREDEEGYPVRKPNDREYDGIMKE